MNKPSATVLVLTLALLPAIRAIGQEATTARKLVVPPVPADRPFLRSTLIDVESLPDNWQEHPLARALKFAAEHQSFIDQHVRDFSCILAKRERIDGLLGDYEYLRTNVRREQRGGEYRVPFAVYAEFLAPKKVQGRRVLYIDGYNGNKMLVRKGGLRFAHVVVNIDPTSDAALRESRYPITELGLINVVNRLVDQARHDIIADPDAKNTEVVFFRGAEIDGQSCTHIRVTHPTEDSRFSFHEANIYVDDKLHVPLRVETYTWPKDASDEPVLLEEYTYMRLKINIGLSDDDFSADRVRQ